MSTLLLRFGIILEKPRDRHERSENAVQWNVGITDMKPRVRHNFFGTRQTNRSSIFSRELEFKGGILGLAVTLLRVYPKIGVGVYRPL